MGSLPRLVAVIQIKDFTSGRWLERSRGRASYSYRYQVQTQS